MSESTPDKPSTPARQRPPAPGALLLSLDQAGALLGVSRRSVERLIADGQLTPRRIGRRRVMVPRVELERFAAGGSNRAPAAQYGAAHAAGDSPERPAGPLANPDNQRH